MKVLLAFLAAALIAVIGAGGYYVYDKMQSGELELPAITMQKEPEQQQADKAQSEKNGKSGKSGKGKVTVGSTKKTNAETSPYETLDLAMKANKDTVAWLQLKGAEIDDSVLQYLDNTYYERRDERKNYDVYGCYFMDYECSTGTRKTLAKNTVIYGHSAPNDDPDGKRFSKLFRFTSPDFAKENPCITLTTPEEMMLFEIFAVFYTDTNFDYIMVHISDDQMLEIANTAKELSLYDYGIDITADDKLLTLSTCSDRDGKDGTHRFVVMGRLMPEHSMPKESASFTEK